MTLGQEIEIIRRECNLPMRVVCDIFNTTEGEYHQITTGRRRPTVFQLIMFIDATRRPLNSINAMTYRP